MTMSISGKEWTLVNLFGKDFVFTIPPYQRPYSWEVENATELFDDLIAALGDAEIGADLSEAAPYFLGSVVVIKNHAEKPECEVVDGQQRLTTLTILLAALREGMVNDKLRQSILQLIYEPENPLLLTPARYRLTLRPRDAEFFRKYVQHEGALARLGEINEASVSDSQRNLVRNAKALVKRVGDLTPQRRELLAQYLAMRCFLVVVSTSTFDAAYRIFNVLNDRGLDLSPADILKADVLGKIDDGKREAYAQRWEQIEEELGRDPFRDLFTHLRMVFVQKKPEKNVLHEFRELVLSKQPSSEHFIEQVLEPYADAFSIVRGAAYKSTVDATAINGLLRWLERIDNVDWVPLALVFVHRLQNDPEKLRVALHAVERLASVLMVGRADVNERQNRYGAALSALTAPGADPAKVLAPTDNELKRARAVADGDLYLNAKVRGYVLLRVDAALAEAKAPIVRENPSVEHVLPQSPAANSRWLEWWPEAAQREAWTHRLGNLLLLTGRKNSQASNYDFDEKKKRYFTTKGGVTNFAITTKVLEEASWTAEVVTRRQKELMEVLERSWVG